ncbi:MAG: sigma-E processing peptidase SpoIIGA [Oscillospiraceae bacterium]|nr:sigma-E processing peptidase SpoIIGA [Oscillospiraceae bacterium]
MVVYLDLVMLVNFLVDLLLLIAANRLCGYPVKIKRAVLSAGIGAVYAGVCILPGFRFLGNVFWRLMMLALMSGVAFGWNASILRRSAIFVFLSMALGGIALGLGNGSIIALIAAAAGVCILCVVGFRGGAAAKEYVTVQLTYGGVTRELTALLDTGNALKDPITGQSVLVVGSDVAKQMLGLSQGQLLAPIETVAQGKIPGLRLIPYRSVGNANGMMLAIKMDRVCVGKQEIGNLVAFAPQILGAGEFGALIGGAL